MSSIKPRRSRTSKNNHEPSPHLQSSEIPEKQIKNKIKKIIALKP